MHKHVTNHRHEKAYNHEHVEIHRHKNGKRHRHVTNHRHVKVTNHKHVHMHRHVKVTMHKHVTKHIHVTLHEHCVARSSAVTNVKWDKRRYNASMAHTFRFGSAGKVIVSASINFDGKHATASMRAVAVGRRARVNAVDIFCREEHWPKDNGCGNEPGVNTAKRTFTLNDDANYHLDFEFAGFEPKTASITFGEFQSPQFSCRKGRKRGRRCRFN